jgi:PTS system nitrogen regulatory IIA component
VTLLPSLLPPEHVLLDVAAADKHRVFELAGELLEGESGVHRAQIVSSLAARERNGSTALGHGIAIPHGRVKRLHRAMGAFIRTREPIPFDAPDDAPVRLVFVLLVPEKSTDLHLEILSELAQLFSDRTLRRSLAEAPDALTAQRLITGHGAQSAG